MLGVGVSGVGVDTQAEGVRVAVCGMELQRQKPHSYLIADAD